MLKLGKTEFKVKKADLSAAFRTWDDEEDTEFVWCIDIELEEGQLIFDDEEYEGEDDYEDDYEETVSPSLYHDNGFRIDNVHSWKELEGVILEWEDRENDNGEDAGYIYTFEHDAITEGKIEFLKRNGNKYLVRWSGMVEDEIPFEFEGELDFTGIEVDSASISNKEELKSAMMQFIDMEEFKCVLESGYNKDDGERHNIWRFVPKDAN